MWDRFFAMLFGTIIALAAIWCYSDNVVANNLASFVAGGIFGMAGTSRGIRKNGNGDNGTLPKP